MNSLGIVLDNDTARFTPGEAVAGRVTWAFDAPPEALELRLFWRTEGKGDEDVSVVETVRIDGPGLSGERAFEFPAPEGPYSFSGKLISLIWALELLAVSGKESARQDIVLSSDGAEIVLGTVTAPEEAE
ncbi:MAG: hypothetical protein JXR94_16230 [Candidatus Hydrogenedentes bacterium]|nr:hypothetical protein [Candidatus Hydrogenedentota bacterium]